jgi:predicted peptidase
LKYLLYLPISYYKENHKEFPLILFLHGTGERGEDIELVKKPGIPKIVDDREDFPFITVSPQCPKYS